eukprot:CAMPEP_0115155400 /NCGR_PEP_ID=MMETSP0227-20121206/67862_1 /TAXON_ID=89957 /ORGANISM="Polarella glacialis, Strain CCMP 1383" /LENGTH=67 /DNA_ID=CAMNT_0002566449 /DNA_START=38 /DNA_END=238 /DNA_ORIENTATION=+
MVVQRRTLDEVIHHGLHEDAHPCWAGTYTHQRCCMHGDTSCFDVFHTPEVCCRLQPNRSATWWGSAP